MIPAVPKGCNNICLRWKSLSYVLNPSSDWWSLLKIHARSRRNFPRRPQTSPFRKRLRAGSVFYYLYIDIISHINWIYVKIKPLRVRLETPKLRQNFNCWLKIRKRSSLWGAPFPTPSIYRTWSTLLSVWEQGLATPPLTSLGPKIAPSATGFEIVTRFDSEFFKDYNTNFWIGFWLTIPETKIETYFEPWLANRSS